MELFQQNVRNLIERVPKNNIRSSQIFKFELNKINRLNVFTKAQNVAISDFTRQVSTVNFGFGNDLEWSVASDCRNLL